MVVNYKNMTVIGNGLPNGIYVLLIIVLSDLDLAFGRFKKGKVIHLPRSEYVYTGSAMGKNGATCLARRLVRHATRTSDRVPHQIRTNMLDFFSNLKLATGEFIPRTPKTLYWNIDHLLNRNAVEIKGLACLRTDEPLEAKIGKQLELRPDTNIIEKVLGANDIKGNTHLLRFADSQKNWPSLIDSLVQTWSAHSD